jgi:AraC-like DNA-binding protein
MEQPQFIAVSGVDMVVLHRHPAVAAIASDEAARWAGLLPWQVKRVSAYVDGQLATRLSIRDAAQHAKLSPSYFSRCFRQCFGLTFSKFVARRRIDRAKSLMVRSSSNLSQIALDCGFTDQAHFTRTFGALTGSTPSQWRRHAAKVSGFPRLEPARQTEVIASW